MISIIQGFRLSTPLVNRGIAGGSAGFPASFMFQLTWDELSLLKSQSAISNGPQASSSRSQIVILKRGQHMKYRPYAFAARDILMLPSVLISEGERCDYEGAPLREE